MAAREKWLRAARHLPAPLFRWAERKIWSGPFRHLRGLDPEISATVHPDGRWTLEKSGMRPVQSVPLESLGRIGIPVSIVATGPSARDHRWQTGRGIVAVNGAPTFLAGLGIQPDLLVVTDPKFAETGRAHFKKAPGLPLVTTFKAASALAVHAPEELANRPFAIIERVNAWHGVPALSLKKLVALNEASGTPFYFTDGDQNQPKAGWSMAPALGFFSGCNVVFAALQVVVGLGAREIEIIGMDLSGHGRVYQEGSAPQPSLLEAQYEEFILPSFAVMHRALEGSDIRIRNLSPVCPLPREFFQP